MQMVHPLLAAALAKKAAGRSAASPSEPATGLGFNPLFRTAAPGEAPTRGALGSGADIESASFLPLSVDRRSGEVSFDPRAGFLGMLLDAFRLPGDVLAGRVDPRSEEGLDRTLDLAGLLAGGGFLSRRPAGSLGMGGRAARAPSTKFDLELFAGQPVTILQNPSRERMLGLARRSKYKALRRIVDPDTGDVWVWDATDPMLHERVAADLGLTSERLSFDGLFLEEGDEFVRVR